MNHNEFDFLIPKVSTEMMHHYLNILSTLEYFEEDVDTSPLLNLTISVFLSSLRKIFGVIRMNTEGEDDLLKNIQLVEDGLIKFFQDLPFVTSVENF